MSREGKGSVLSMNGFLHARKADRGKSPVPIAQVVAAAKWLANNHGIRIIGEITSKTLADIRQEGKDREKGQVDDVEHEDMLREVAIAESEKAIAGL